MAGRLALIPMIEKEVEPGLLACDAVAAVCDEVLASVARRLD